MSPGLWVKIILSVNSLLMIFLETIKERLFKLGLYWLIPSRPFTRIQLFHCWPCMTSASCSTFYIFHQSLQKKCLYKLRKPLGNIFVENGISQKHLHQYSVMRGKKCFQYDWKLKKYFSTENIRPRVTSRHSFRRIFKIVWFLRRFKFKIKVLKIRFSSDNLFQQVNDTQSKPHMTQSCVDLRLMVS